MRPHIYYKKIIIIVGLFVLIYGQEIAGKSATLNWNASTGDVLGYTIYYGLFYDNYPFSVNVGNVTQFSLHNFSLIEGATYYFIVRAYNIFGESGNSNVAIYSVPSVDEGSVENIPPNKAILSSPSGRIPDSTPTFTWHENSVSTWYRLWIGPPNEDHIFSQWDDRIFAQWYEASDICSGSTCSVTIEIELLDGNFEWYIKSWNDYGKVWSDGMSFTVSE